MKKLLHVFFILVTINLGNSQINLVPNYSFEDYVNCLETPPWISPSMGTPDFFNTCDLSNVQGVPDNFIGSQFAKTGVGYWGLITFTYQPCTSDFNIPGREYLQVELTEQLQVGKEYCATFFVSLADSSYYAANDIGILFTSQAISSTTISPLNYAPQISNNPILNPLTNKYGWTEVSGKFISDGTEKYITIGNFKNDAQTDTLTVGGAYWAWCTYYYIDDVSVMLLM